MTALVLLGACAVILTAASLFVVGVAVGFGIARRRYEKRRNAVVTLRVGGVETGRFAVPLRVKDGDLI